MSDFKFLDKVLVSRFTASVKRYDDARRCNVRIISNKVNGQAMDVYTVVGVACLKEGDICWEVDGGYWFEQRKSHKVYIVAKTLGRRKYALPSDMTLVEEATTDE